MQMLRFSLSGPLVPSTTQTWSWVAPMTANCLLTMHVSHIRRGLPLFLHAIPLADHIWYPPADVENWVYTSTPRISVTEVRPGPAFGTVSTTVPFSVIVHVRNRQDNINAGVFAPFYMPALCGEQCV